MTAENPSPSRFQRLLNQFGWTRHSSILLGGFFLVCALIVYIWWPLAQEAMRYMELSGEWWRYFDWLLVGIFAFMSVAIMSHADLKTDALIVFVGTFGGLVIESWGTQTNLWFYYTAERPPIWIIPAWPIASLCIDRLTRLLKHYTDKLPRSKGIATLEKTAYWGIFVGFYIYMMIFVAPSLPKTFTLVALLLCAVFILTPTDERYAILTFLAGSGLGYFLELWGTTRQCWTYYTFQTPPFFAVLAHGMAAVAFWRGGLLVRLVLEKLQGIRIGVRIRLPGNDRG